MSSESRQGSNDGNVPAGKALEFNLGEFTLTENPTKKVVKKIHEVEKFYAISRPNPITETVISSGSVSTILRPETALEPTLSPRCRKSSSTPRPVQIVDRFPSSSATTGGPFDSVTVT
ncbi:hypothetical protein ACH5RR_021191 [Cinchona calisaya]|uniref:Uncharacterized protein n=1 Tax=Cinchona calisaya TaxID=153742 RepID=A0ABD2ZJI6_9GENT